MQTTTEQEKHQNKADFACPICFAVFDFEHKCCENGHTFKQQNGVFRLMKPQFARQLDRYLSKFESIRARQGWQIRNTNLFPQLPYISESDALGHWKPKQYDLEEIRKSITRKNLKILDLGAWNGWLSNQLAGDGHRIIAADYFIDERDGLGAKKYYLNDFMAIQMDLEELSILPCDFDLIIINRGLPYFANFTNHIKRLKKRLNPGGKIIITGIAIYQSGKKRATWLERYKAEYKEKYGSELFFRPAKGFLDKNDFEALRNEKFDLLPYSQMWKYNLKAKIFPKFPHFYLGLYQNEPQKQ